MYCLKVLLVEPLEFHPCGPKDVLTDEVAVSCGGVVEEGSIPSLSELHSESDPRVEEISDGC